MRFAKTLPMIVGLGLAGCASHDSLHMINGGYYMVGGSDCTQTYTEPSGAIACYNKQGVKTGYRTAMSQGDVAQYSYNQSQAQAYMQSMNQQNQQMNQNIQQWGNSIGSGYMNTPAVGPYGPVNSQGLVWCRRLGSYVVTCRE